MRVGFSPEASAFWERIWQASAGADACYFAASCVLLRRFQHAPSSGRRVSDVADNGHAVAIDYRRLAAALNLFPPGSDRVKTKRIDWGETARPDPAPSHVILLYRILHEPTQVGLTHLVLRFGLAYLPQPR